MLACVFLLCNEFSGLIAAVAFAFYLLAPPGMTVEELALVVNARTHKKEHAVLSRLSAEDFPNLAAGFAAGGLKMRTALASLLKCIDKNPNLSAAKMAAECTLVQSISKSKSLDFKGTYIYADELLEKCKFDKNKADEIMARLKRSAGGTIKCPNLLVDKFWWGTEQTTNQQLKLVNEQRITAQGDASEDFVMQMHDQFADFPELPGGGGAADTTVAGTASTKNKRKKQEKDKQEQGDENAADSENAVPDAKQALPVTPMAFIENWQGEAVLMLGTATASVERLLLVGCQESLIQKLQVRAFLIYFHASDIRTTTC